MNDCKKEIRIGLIFLVLIIHAAINGELVICADEINGTTVQVVEWTHLSSAHGDLPSPSNSTDQTVALILDVDNDDLNDFVIGCRRGGGPSVVWYKRHPDGWDKLLIDSEPLDIEAGGAVCDIDNDGDLDIVMGGDALSNEVWWWENPFPVYEQNTPWVRRVIKNSGFPKHHDQIFGDFDGDGQTELVFWNQGGNSLILSEIPDDPGNTQPWLSYEIFSWSDDTDYEGLAKADVDLDGKIDIVGGGLWFKHSSDNIFTPNVIDSTQRSSRAAVGQLIEGGRPEAVFAIGDGVGRLKWYEWIDGVWVPHDLLGVDADHAHSLELVDVNQDGYLDIFAAEMRLNSTNEDAKMWVCYGDGLGNFQKFIIGTGYGNHESTVGDLNGDGRPDILGKPFNWDTPRIDIRFSETGRLPLDLWQRHVIDSEKPWGSIFITSADVDGDNKKDIITGGWWYKNPGVLGEVWNRNIIGSPLNNMASVYDFDNDGDMDILGSQGEGHDPNDLFVWARNSGDGLFEIFENVSEGNGDFLQGVVVGEFDSDENVEVVLSWHDDTKGIQKFDVPLDLLNEVWPWSLMSPISQGEDLSSGDIDGDGDLDLFLGTKWLRNNDTFWDDYTACDTLDAPDRNCLADINGDGRVDAVVGFEAISGPGKIAWYEQGDNPFEIWTEHTIATIIGPMSIDAGDMDGDGDLDVIAGEHNLADPDSARLFIFENLDGVGNDWAEYIIYTGDEHHDGTRLVDIDKDGDLDIISIGWSHSRVLLYENRAIADGGIPENQPPVASIVALPQSGKVPLLVNFNALGSSDPDGQIISWKWDFGDGGTGSGNAVSYEYSLAGEYTAVLTVTDNEGARDTAITVITVSPVPSFPVITKQPVNQTVMMGEYAAFSVEATGTEPLSYQWQKDGADIVGAIQANYTTPAAKVEDNNTSYCCMVSNDAGSVTSDSAYLYVTDRPVRVIEGLQVLYTFEEATGTTVYDVSGVGSSLNLEVSDQSRIAWTDGGLIVLSPSIIASAGPATRIIDSCRASNEITVEAWIKPANTTQDGPALLKFAGTPVILSRYADGILFVAEEEKTTREDIKRAMELINGRPVPGTVLNKSKFSR